MIKIEIKIMDKEEKIWSLPVNIDDFIVDPFEIEFRWENGSTLPYKDFIFYGSDFYYGIFINNINVKEISSISKIKGEKKRIMDDKSQKDYVENKQ